MAKKEAQVSVSAERKEKIDRLKRIQEYLEIDSVRAFAIRARVDVSQFDKIMKGTLPLTKGVVNKLITNLSVNPAFIKNGQDPAILQNYHGNNSVEDIDVVGYIKTGDLLSAVLFIQAKVNISSRMIVKMHSENESSDIQEQMDIFNGKVEAEFLRLTSERRKLAENAPL